MESGSGMTIDEADAKIIVEMAKVCAAEGIAPPFDALLRRIEDAFHIEVPGWVYGQ